MVIRRTRTARGRAHTLTEHTIALIAAVGVLALACQVMAWWLKLPAILFLLLIGILAGPVTGWIDPQALLGDLLFPFISLSVAIILFEGSLTLKFEEIRGLERVVQRLITVGLLTTWIVTSLAARWLANFSWEIAFLFGAVTVVTGPTVIVPMLRTVRPTAHIANILRWEGIVIDPIGALLAVLVFEFILAGQGGAALGHAVVVFGEIIAGGFTLGAVGGQALGIVLRRHLLPEYLHNLATLALLAGIFALSNLLVEESGLLAVTVMGVWLANMKDVNIEDILDFKESLSLLLISILFILLAARVEFSQIQQLGWAAAGVFVVIQFVARPLKVAIATLGSSLRWRERALLSWIAPRGIVAAAISALFALRLQDQGYPQAALMVPLTFLVIIGTVVLQSATARPLARWLGVAEPEARGFLMIGANPVARHIAEALHEQGVDVILTDSYWDNIRAARMAGLRTFYGNAVSEYADRHLDLVGIGSLLALSPQDDVNALASLRYRPEFGANAVYSLVPSTGKGEGGKHVTAVRRFGRLLFADGITFTKLSSLISQGAEIRSTTLSEDFDYDAFLEERGAKTIQLFAITPKGDVKPFTTTTELKPGSGWKVIALTHGEQDAATG